MLDPDNVIFQYPLMDRLGFWGMPVTASTAALPLFQYPLMDRLGFWGVLNRRVSVGCS